MSYFYVVKAHKRCYYARMEIDVVAIKIAVKNSGYKINWLAEQIGVTARTLSRFLNGKTRLGKPALILLLQVLNLKEAMLKKAS